MTKYLKFSVTVQTGRTFELPLDKAIEIIKNGGGDPTDWNECDLSEELYNFYSDDISEFEVDNNYYETHVQDEEIYE